MCDAGCGPSGHIGKYLFDKGHSINGIDISEKCIELASINNPHLTYICADIGNMPFENNSFDAVISYYSIINTPKIFILNIFSEFCRVLKPGGYLLVAVKAGREEGIVEELLGYSAGTMKQLRQRAVNGTVPVAVLRLNGQGEKSVEDYCAIIPFSVLVELLLGAGYGNDTTPTN